MTDCGGESCGFELLCHGCGAAAAEDAPWTCPACGEPRALRPLARPSDALLMRPPRSMWHYFGLLPLRARRDIVTLGEGATPLIEADALGAEYGLAGLLLKNETVNPTGSFKDRQLSASLSRARALGAQTVAVVSSGNVACAAAAYAARAGLHAVVFAHGQAGGAKLAQAAAYGARVLRIDSPAPSVAFDVCRAACARWGWHHLSTAGMYDPYTVEGAKTIAYELYQQTRGALPDWIVAPVGGGGLLGGLWRGLCDLQRWGLIPRVPRIAGVQAAGCAPLKRAIDGGETFLDSLRAPWPSPKTIAGGIADDILFDGHTALPAIRTTGGRAIAVDDGAIEAAIDLLARRAGLLLEPSAAVAVAALDALRHDAAGQRVCLILTGHGLKDLARRGLDAPGPLLPPDLDAIAAAPF